MFSTNVRQGPPPCPYILPISPSAVYRRRSTGVATDMMQEVSERTRRSGHRISTKGRIAGADFSQREKFNVTPARRELTLPVRRTE